MNITHAIIPVAGYGTRRLPIAKAVEKCLLPVLNRPIIDYTIQDCIKAGITTIIVIISEGQGGQFKQYYGHDRHLEGYLEANNKQQYLDMVQPPKGVHFEYVVQPRSAPYGTATPVALARHLVPKGRSAVVLMGDDMVYGERNVNPIAELVNEAGDAAAALTVKVPRHDVSQYGVLDVSKDGSLKHIVEKPRPDEAPSTMINISKYVFTSDLLDEVVKFYKEPPLPGREKYVTAEPLERYMSRGNKIKVVTAKGTYLDTGTVEKWLYANNFVAQREKLARTR